MSDRRHEGQYLRLPASALDLMRYQQFLNHMSESAFYNESDLLPFSRRLAELRQILQSDAESGRHAKALIKVLERHITECGTLVSV